ncbi:helix-turn-helix domain-containing protein [Streptomyces sp. NPDC102467]|uniref:helix-turn-helix domain-containing protein n=1 Tax=Streptomyces sp. NPDC102467 TaxID=3366179 RepID=UPI0038277549
MAEQQRGRRAIEVGPTGKTVAANIVRLRDRHSMTTRQLSGVLERAGRPIPPSGITRMEKGERVVTADELVALAVAFGVSPGALLLPLNDRPGTLIEVTGAGEVDAADAWDWAEGQRPLKAVGRDEHAAELEFLVNGVPRFRRVLRQHPAGRALVALQQRVDALIARSSYIEEGDAGEVQEVAEATRYAAERLVAEVNYVDGENAKARIAPRAAEVDG